MGKQWKQYQTLFFWTPKSLQMVTAAMKLKDAENSNNKPPKLTQDETDNSNNSIQVKKIVVKSFKKSNLQAQMVALAHSTKYLKKN